MLHLVPSEQIEKLKDWNLSQPVVKVNKHYSVKRDAQTVDMRPDISLLSLISSPTKYNPQLISSSQITLDSEPHKYARYANMFSNDNNIVTMVMPSKNGDDED